MVTISAPVGVRFRTQNVRNNAADQQKIIALLHRIPGNQGGKREAWPAAPLAGVDGNCPQFLRDAIWDFQAFWKARGTFKNIDGVVDPGGNTLRRLNALTGSPVPPGPGPAPAPRPRKVPRVPGTWQIVDIATQTVGEGGLAGALNLHVVSPDNRLHILTCLGAGLGISKDPLDFVLSKLKLLVPDARLFAKFLQMLGKNGTTNLGDFLQSLSGTTTRPGAIVANPLFGQALSHALVFGPGTGQLIRIVSASGFAGAGGEAGAVFFGEKLYGFGALLGGQLVTSEAIGVYALGGLAAKLGVGAQFMCYTVVNIERHDYFGP